MRLNNSEVGLFVRRELLISQLLYFTINMEKLYMLLQTRFNARVGTADTHMTLQEMTKKLKSLQQVYPTEFSKMWPPEVAFDVETPGPA